MRRWFFMYSRKYAAMGFIIGRLPISSFKLCCCQPDLTARRIESRLLENMIDLTCLKKILAKCKMIDLVGIVSVISPMGNLNPISSLNAGNSLINKIYKLVNNC